MFLAVATTTWWSQIAESVGEWFSEMTGHLHFFSDALSVVWSTVDSIIMLNPYLPTFIVGFIGLGLFCLFGNIILKVI